MGEKTTQMGNPGAGSAPARGSAHRFSAATVTLAVLVLVTFFTNLYMQGLNSGIPYYYDTVGASAAIGGTFVAVFTLSSMVMRLIGGQLTDLFPHYQVLLVSLGIMFIGVALPAIWDTFAVSMASRVLQGGAFAVATNVMTVAVIGSSPKKTMGKRLGIKGAGTSLGTMFGALISTGLIDGIGYRAFYVFYALLMVAAVGAILWLRREQRKRATEGERALGAGRSENTARAASGASAPRQSAFERFIAPFLMPEAAPFMIISLARRLPKGFCVTFILIFAKYAGIDVGAAFFVTVGATTLACRLLGGRLFDSDSTWLLLPLQSVEIVGFVIFALAPNLPTLIIAAIGYGFTVGTTSPLMKALMAKKTPREHWGAVNGELFFFADIGKAGSAFFGGVIIDAISKAMIPAIALAFTIAASAITALALLIGRKVWAPSKIERA